MVYSRDREVWGAVLFRTTNPEVVEGAICDAVSDCIGPVKRPKRRCWSGCESGRKLLLLETSSGKVPKTLLLVVLPAIPIMLL